MVLHRDQNKVDAFNLWNVLAGTERIKQGQHKHQVRLTSPLLIRTVEQHFTHSIGREQPLLLPRTPEHNCSALEK